MIFYEVLGTSAAPCQLVGTQVDAKRMARERGTSWEQVNVPTDKDGLMAYVNTLKAGVNAEMHRETCLTFIDEAGTITEDQFKAVTKPHMTQAQVDKMFEPTERTSKLTPDDVDQVCILIEGMRGAAIGHVAHSLAARIERLGKEMQA